IRKAASNLNVASSAISRQIIALEEHLGVQLFERMPRRIRLTAAGEIIVAHARETLREQQRMLAHIEDLRGSRNASASIATMGGLASDLLAIALGGFRAEHALSRFSVTVLPAPDIVAAVVAGEADLGFAFDLPPAPHISVAAS